MSRLPGWEAHMLARELLIKAFAYNEWANGRILEQAQKVSAEQWAGKEDVEGRSLRKLLLDRCDFAVAEGADPIELRDVLFRRAAEQRRQLASTARLDADALARTLPAFEDKFGEFLPAMEWVNFGGGQVDITSGKFVFSCTEAYKVENGKVGAPVKGAMLIGNGPDILTKVTKIGADLELT